MKPLPLTAIVLAHQDNRKLTNAVASVQFASEIIIVDNNSGVNFKHWELEKPVRVIPHAETISNFSKVRNEAITKASNEWVLFLDSDEEVVAPAVPQLAALIASNAQGGVVIRSDVFHGKRLEYGEAGNQSIIRLGRKQSITFHGSVHEVAEIKGELLYTNIHLLHHAHDSVQEFIADVSAYAQLAANQKTTSFNRNIFEMLTFPLGKLLYGLFIQGGIIDGWPGVVYAFCMSLHSLLVRMYRYEILAKSSLAKK